MAARGEVMAQILVRDLAPETVEQLKQRAKRNNRSLEAEVRAILDDEAARDSRRVEAWDFALRLSKSLEGRQHSDSTELIREDRER
jgi:plasmid stability protein